MRLSDGKGGLTPITDESDPETIFDGAIAGYKNEDGETIELLTRDDIAMLIDCCDYDEEEAVIDIVFLDSHFDDDGGRRRRTGSSSSYPLRNFTVTKQSVSLHNGYAINSLSYNNHFTQFVSTGGDRRTVLYDVVKKKVLWSDTGSNAVLSSSYSPVRDHFLVSDYGGVIRLFDATKDVTKIKKRSTFKVPGSNIWHTEYFPCGGLFVASGTKKGTNVFDIASGKIVANYDEGSDVFDSTIVNRTVVAHAPDASPHCIKLFDIRGGNSSYPALHGHTDTIWSLQTSASGNEILSSGIDGTVVIHDLRTGKPTLTITASTLTVRCAIFAGDQQQYVAAGACDFTVKIWDTLSGSLHRTHSVGQSGNEYSYSMCYSRNQFYCGTLSGDLFDVSW